MKSKRVSDERMLYYWTRLFCNKVKQPLLESARKWVEDLELRKVRINLFAIRFDRASGPGGQNVNKVNSKCTLTLYNLSNCTWLPSEVRKQISEKSRYYGSSNDSIVIQASESRSRETNKQIALQKFVNHIKDVCWFPREVDEITTLKWKMIKNNSHEKRLKSKKIHSNKKKLRKKQDFF